MTKKETTKFIVQIIVSIASAILTALGATPWAIGRGILVTRFYSLMSMTNDMSQFFRISIMRSSSKEMQPPV